MKSEDKLQEILKSIKSQADHDFYCMHVMSKDEFISEYISEVMDVMFTYYNEQYEVAREHYIANRNNY